MRIQAALPALLLSLCVTPLFAADADLDASIAKHRMGTLVIRTAPNAKVTVEQLRHEFWFGATLPGSIFNGKASPEDLAKFKAVFTSHFNAGVIEGDFKWHAMERERGHVDYSVVDAMLAWADREGIPLRGHCIYWGIPNRVQNWVKELPDDELRLALEQRGRSIVARYRGRFAEYDLNNEMIHANYYDILTGLRLADYVKHIQTLRTMGVPLAGIGVQGHLHGDTFDPVALQNALDELAQFNLPIRVTEFNFPGQRSKYYTTDQKGKLTPAEEQAKAAALRQYFRICFAHPSVTGIMLWGFWEGANWIPQSSLYNRDWTATPAAEAYRDLVYKQWWTRWSGQTNADGYAVIRAFYGKHRVTINGVESVVTLSKADGVKVVEEK